MGQVVDRAGGAGEMEHVLHRAVDLHRLGDVVLQKPEAGVIGQMIDVPPRSRQQIVDADDLMPLGEEALAEMRANKAGSSSNDGSQRSPPDMNPSSDTKNREKSFPGHLMIQVAGTIMKPAITFSSPRSASMAVRKRESCSLRLTISGLFRLEIAAPA